MKKRCLFCVFLFCFMMLTGCEKTPNMSDLLAYEKENICFGVIITDDTQFSASFTIEEGKDCLRFSEGDLNGIQIEFEKDGKVNLVYEDYQMALPSSSLLKALRWKELFHLSEKNLLWKIQKETLGGLAVYACHAEDLTVYIDAVGFLPLKIVQNDLTIDIMESKNLSPIIPKSIMIQ